MHIHIIAAIAHNRAIGFNNRLLYHLPDDMRFFREQTTGHTVLMGRKTYESLPKGALPHRRNIVISSTIRTLPGCDCFPSLQQALDSCREDEHVFVIGGASIYAQTVPYAERLLLTVVDDIPQNADAFFPPFDRWLCRSSHFHPQDERHSQQFWFNTYTRY